MFDDFPSLDPPPPEWTKHPIAHLWPFPDKPPREVQLEALQASRNARAQGRLGFAYFMRQRLGKTLTAYADFCILRKEGKVKWMIVICPNSLKDAWKEAIEDVNIYEPINIYKSSNKKRSDEWFEKNTFGGVFIINKESVKAFMENEGWQRFSPLTTYCALDESTGIKEPRNKSTKACLDLGSLIPYPVILTAKPTGNSNADVWSQLKFIKATERNFHQHQFTFCRMGGWKGNQVVQNINENQLKKEIAPYCYIAPDKYIKGFKRVYEPLRRIKLPDQLDRYYKTMLEGLLIEIGDDTEISAPIVLTKYLRLQQISSGIAGDIEGAQHNLISPENNPRIKSVLDILENEATDKTIIPCRFKKSISNLVQVLQRTHKVVVITGGMADKEIAEVKREFNEGSADVLIGQCQVLAYGHTLCGKLEKPTTSMIHFERNFSLLDQAQIECRPENYDWPGLEVSHYDFFCSEMDKYILKALIRKEDAATSLMGYARKHGILNNNEL